MGCAVVYHISYVPMMVDAIAQDRKNPDRLEQVSKFPILKILGMTFITLA